MLKHCVGNGRHVMKPLHVCLMYYAVAVVATGRAGYVLYRALVFFRFHATLYQCPETAPEREEMTVAVANRINDLQSVLRTTEDHSLTQLQEIGQEINTWQTKVYHSGGCFNYS